MEKLIHGREIPADILYQMTSDSPDEEYMYYSESKGSLISIFDMQIHHFIRAYAIQNKTDKNRRGLTFQYKSEKSFYDNKLKLKYEKSLNIQIYHITTSINFFHALRERK